MKKLRLITLFLLVTTFILAGFALLLPTPPGAEDAMHYAAIGTSVTILDAFFAVSAGVLFLLALKGFKPELKPAYQLIAVGAVALGVLTLVDPYIEYYGLWEDPFFNTLSFLAYFFGSIFTYLGMRQFALRTELKTKAASLRFMAIIFAISFVLYNFIPHIDTWSDVPNEFIYDALQVLTVTPVLGYAAAAYMGLRLIRKTGKDYQRAFGWLTFAVGTQAVTSIVIAVLQVTGYDNWFFNSRAYEITYIVGNIALLGAAYYFNALAFPRPKKHRWFGLWGTEQDATSIDLIIFVVDMAANPRELDVELDKMRELTVNLEPGEQLNAEDQETLKEVYVAIEDHLVSHDKLRVFEREKLRATVTKHFGLGQADAPVTFWPLLEPPQS